MDVPSEVSPIEQGLQCPITFELMLDPVIAADGYSYERSAMENWIAKKGAGALSPMTGIPLRHLELLPNITLRTVIELYKEALLRQEQTNAQLMAIQWNRQAKTRIPLSANERVNQKAQSVAGRVKSVEIIELLFFTAKGQLNKVRNSLNLNRNLIHAQGNISDLSGRSFPKITGFQRAILSGNEAVWNVYLEFLPKAEAHDQLMALINERLDITRKHVARGLTGEKLAALTEWLSQALEKVSSVSPMMDHKRG